jgi:hypothetical protein
LTHCAKYGSAATAAQANQYEKGKEMKRHAHYSTISDLSSRLGPNSLEALSVGTMRDDHVLRHLRRRKKEHVAPLAVVLTMSGNEGETLKK